LTVYITTAAPYLITSDDDLVVGTVAGASSTRSRPFMRLWSCQSIIFVAAGIQFRFFAANDNLVSVNFTPGATSTRDRVAVVIVTGATIALLFFPSDYNLVFGRVHWWGRSRIVVLFFSTNDDFFTFSFSRRWRSAVNLPFVSADYDFFPFDFPLARGRTGLRLISCNDDFFLFYLSLWFRRRRSTTRAGSIFKIFPLSGPEDNRASGSSGIVFSHESWRIRWSFSDFIPNDDLSFSHGCRCCG